LCWDEIEITEIADAMMFGRILDELARYPVTVIMTSNRPPQQLYQGLHAEMFHPTVERIQETMQCLTLDSGQDYRQHAKTLQVHTRYTSSTEDRRAMWDHFLQLIHPMVAQPQHYALPGRSLRLAHVAGAIAWASFDELCAKSLSTLDYGVLAEHVHTLFIESVPALAACPRDQIRRWIWLIDILYDRKVKVVLGLQAPLANPGGEWQFEIERTLSRLQEMQYWLS
jgi:cell division protein ZapE